MKFNFVRNFLAAVAIWTMIFSPVALGLQSQSQFDRITEAQIKSMLIDLGLNKKSTYAQFWNRTKHLYPAQVYSEVEAYFKAQPSTVMPAFEVTYTQVSGGEKVPTIKVTDRGQSYNVEIIGQLNEWARVNQVSLSESDLMRLKPAIEKLSPGSTKLETYRKDFSRFEGFPRMTPQLWRTMKPEDRAAYIVKMRLLWFDARRVIESNNPEASAQPLQRKPKKTSSFQEFLKLMIGEEAIADDRQNNRLENLRRYAGDKPRPEAAFSAQELKSESSYGRPCTKKTTTETGGGCIVAGQVAPLDGHYTMTWNSTSAKTGQLSCGCSHDSVVLQNVVATLKGAESSGSKVTSDIGIGIFTEQDDLNSKCKQKNNPGVQGKSPEAGKWVACKPELYSFNPKDGSPYCVHTMTEAFQYATTFEGMPGDRNRSSCDQQSQLNTSAYKITNPGTPDWVQTEKEQAKKDYELTQNYLNGMLMAKKNGITLKNILEDKVYDVNDKGYDAKKVEELDNFLVRTQDGFEKEIKRAADICTKAKVSIDKNFEPACAQLHRRWLFTEKYLAQFRGRSCLSGTEYIGLYESKENITSSKTVKVGPKSLTKTELNKLSLAQIRDQGLLVCQCRGSEKAVGFGQKCDERTPALIGTFCPKGSKPAGPGEAEAVPSWPRDRKEVCICDSNKKQFPAVDDRAKNEELMKITCATTVVPPPGPQPEDREVDCSRYYPGASPVDKDNNCKCTDGSRNGNTPVRKSKGPANASPEYDTVTADTGPEEWTCYEDKVSLWPLAPFALIALLMLKKKKNNPPPTCQAPKVLYLGDCVCKFAIPGACPKGANADCTGCAIVPTCTDPISAGDYPNCYCPNRDTCTGKNQFLQPSSCECQAVEGGTTPDTCVGTECTGGTPPLAPTGR